MCEFFLFSLGQSVEFRTIWALEISGNLEMAQPDVPKIRFVAGVHGDAAVGPELLLEFASVLCLNYGRNPTITKAGNQNLVLYFVSLNNKVNLGFFSLADRQEQDTDSPMCEP